MYFFVFKKELLLCTSWAPIYHIDLCYTHTVHTFDFEPLKKSHRLSIAANFVRIIFGCGAACYFDGVFSFLVFEHIPHHTILHVSSSTLWFDFICLEKRLIGTFIIIIIVVVVCGVFFHVFLSNVAQLCVLAVNFRRFERIFFKTVVFVCVFSRLQWMFSCHPAKRRKKNEVTYKINKIKKKLTDTKSWSIAISGLLNIKLRKQ